MSFKIDQEQAESFLNALDPDAKEFTFQTFYDQKGPKEEQFQSTDEYQAGKRSYKQKSQSVATWFHGSLKERIGQLQDLQNKGAGVFVTINKTDLRGRSKNNIIAIRALFVDDDENNQVVPPIKPSIVIRSKRGPHLYFLLKPEEPIELFTPLQKALANCIKTDATIHDLPRVMRLPGSYHLKDQQNPFLVELIETNDLKYSCWEILKHFDPCIGDPNGKN